MNSGRPESPTWFRDPAPAFWPATFWFWHRIPIPAEISWQLADMRAKGIAVVMIQARPALHLEAYLSSAYLDAYRHAAAEALRLGLKLTIYDEYGWMSGHGGGKTVEGADHLRERHMFWTSASAAATPTELTVTGIRSPFLDFLGEVGRKWCYDGEPRWGDWRVVRAMAHPSDTDVFEGDVLPLACNVDIVETGATSCHITVDHPPLPAGWTVTVFVSARCLSSRLVNYLMPEVAERFSEKVYAPLLEATGSAADGFFFDHPYAGFYVWDEHHGNPGNSLLSDEALEAAAGPLELLALVRDIGPRTGALRGNFYAAYSRRMHEAFFGTLSRWAAKHGVGFTGHELLTHVGAWGLHDGLTGIDSRAMPGVDYFGVDAYRSETVVDAADYGPQVAAKVGDSVARAHGRRRCMVEQYSTGRETGTTSLAGQWGLTAERFRAQAIRHLLFGARRILLHACSVALADDGDDRLMGPRFDFPPAFNFEPWWEDCPAIFAELARLSAFLEDGEPMRPVALLYPLESIRADAMSPACGRHFGWWAEALAREGIGYDVVDESMLASALAAGTRYTTLVLPAVTTLASIASALTIAEFAGNGGRLLASGPQPHKTRTCGEDAACTAMLASVLDRGVHLPDAGQDEIAHLAAAQQREAPDMNLDGGPTWSFVSRHRDGYRVAAFNDQPTPRKLTIRGLTSGSTVCRWIPQTGEVTAGETVGNDGRLVIDVGAHHVICLSIELGQPDSAPAVVVSPGGGLMDLPAPINLADGWTLEIAGQPAVPVAVDRGWEVQGHPTFAGAGAYRRRVLLPELPSGLCWNLRLPKVHDTAELWVNGVFVARHFAGDACFTLPYFGANIEIELRVRNTGANKYYAGTPYWDGVPRPSGLGAPPCLEASMS